LAELLPVLRSAGVRAVTASGVLGDPDGADAAEGAALLERLVDDLGNAAKGWWGQL
jgi:creatinine amidohydrolase